VSVQDLLQFHFMDPPPQEICWIPFSSCGLWEL
jgi:hypothetical protein